MIVDSEFIMNTKKTDEQLGLVGFDGFDGFVGFKRLLAAARQDSPPLVDVTAGVMADLAGRKQADVVVWSFAGVSAAAAMITLVFAVRAAQLGGETLGDVLEAVLAVGL